MAQTKRGPKAKPKAVEQVSEEEASMVPFETMAERRASFRKEEVSRLIWHLAAGMLETRAKMNATVHPAAIIEIANQARQLADEVYGPF